MIDEASRMRSLARFMDDNDYFSCVGVRIDLRITAPSEESCATCQCTDSLRTSQNPHVIAANLIRRALESELCADLAAIPILTCLRRSVGRKKSMQLCMGVFREGTLDRRWITAIGTVS